MRQQLKDGRLGRVIAIEAQHTASPGQFIPTDNWRAAPEEAPGGALTAVGVHSLDHMIEFAGRGRDVHCGVGRYLPGRADDTTTIMLRFENGANGALFFSVPTATNFSFTLYGTQGLAEISKPNLQSFRFVPGSKTPPTGAITAPPDEIREHPDFDMLRAELSEFARSVTGRRRYPVPVEDVLHGMSVFDAVVRSANSNRIEAVEGWVAVINGAHFLHLSAAAARPPD